MQYTLSNRQDVVDTLLPLEMVRDYARVYDSQDVPLLNLYRQAAIEFAERYTNKVIGSADVIASMPEYLPSAYLPMGNPASVSSVVAFNGQIDETVKGWRYNPVTGLLCLPAQYAAHTDFLIHYTIDNKESVPAPLIIGMLKLIATWYENREDVSNGVSVAQVPMGHRYCFDLYRNPSAR